MSSTALELGVVDSVATCLRVATLAERIWSEHYPAIIGEAQVAYMLERFQSVTAIASQIDTGHRYRLLLCAGEAVGYCAWRLQAEVLFLSKLYLLAERRGQGLGRQALDHVAAVAQQGGARRIELTVNVANLGAIAAYTSWGFRDDGPVVTDIGGGFVMDDRRLVKEWDPSG